MKKNGMIKGSFVRDLVIAGILMTLMAVFQGQAHAKMIRGEVVAVKEDDSSFSFKYSAPSDAAAAEPFDIVVLTNTKFEKISSLAELRAGDEVAVDAAKIRESGIWEANSVRIVKVRLFQEVLAPTKQPVTTPAGQ